MADTHSGSENQFTEQLRDGTFERTAGGVLAVGSLVMLIGGVLHPPSASAVGVISENVLRWGLSHWLFAGGVFLVSLASLLLVTARSELAADWYTFTSWGAVVLGSLLAVVFLVGEATVLPELAAAGNSAQFAIWRSFIEMGVIVSLFPVSVALLVVAWSQARHRTPRTPAWAAWGGVVAFGIGIVWIVGFGVLGIAALGPLFLVELLGFIWLAWLGVTIVRTDEPEHETDTTGTSTPE